MVAAAAAAFPLCLAMVPPYPPPPSPPPRPFLQPLTIVSSQEVSLQIPPKSAAGEEVHWTSNPTVEVFLCQFRMKAEAEEYGWHLAARTDAAVLRLVAQCDVF
jgi:hypothetical protein